MTTTLDAEYWSDAKDISVEVMTGKYFNYFQVFVTRYRLNRRGKWAPRKRDYQPTPTSLERVFKYMRSLSSNRE